LAGLIDQFLQLLPILVFLIMVLHLFRITLGVAVGSLVEAITRLAVVSFELHSHPTFDVAIVLWFSADERRRGKDQRRDKTGNIESCGTLWWKGRTVVHDDLD
jgi:hypothetical protein